MARDDDVINVAGHRLSTSAIEEVLLTHPGVGDAAVVGVADKLKGQLPLGLVVPRAGFTGDLVQELVAKVRNDLGAVAAFRLITLVQGLPRTRSGIFYDKIYIQDLIFPYQISFNNAIYTQIFLNQITDMNFLHT